MNDEVGGKDKAEATAGAPDKASEPKADAPPQGGRFVGGAGSSATSDSGSARPPTDPEEERDILTPPPPPARRVRHRRVSGRVVVLLVILLLAIGAAGGWYYKRHHTSHAPRALSATHLQADVTFAARVGLHATDLSGWTTTPGSQGDAFASVATTSSAATAAESKAASTLAQCLKVPTADVTRAFGGPSSTRTAQSTTPIYKDPAGAGLTASSVVDVMRLKTVEHSDFKVFATPATFATCYQPYAQAMLPYAPAAAAAGPFTAVTVQATTVPTIANARLHVQAFQITRTAGATSAVTTAVAVFGGRVQAALSMTSPSGFPAATQDALVKAIEDRVIAGLPRK